MPRRKKLLHVLAFVAGATPALIAYDLSTPPPSRSGFVINWNAQEGAAVPDSFRVLSFPKSTDAAILDEHHSSRLGTLRRAMLNALDEDQLEYIPLQYLSKPSAVRRVDLHYYEADPDARQEYVVMLTSNMKQIGLASPAVTFVVLHEDLEKVTVELRVKASGVNDEYVYEIDQRQDVCHPQSHKRWTSMSRAAARIERQVNVGNALFYSVLAGLLSVALWLIISKKLGAKGVS